MHDLRLARWIVGTIGIFLVGGCFTISAFAENKGRPGFAELYPGLAAIAAGYVMIALLKYPPRPIEGEDAAARDTLPESNNESATDECQEPLDIRLTNQSGPSPHFKVTRCLRRTKAMGRSIRPSAGDAGTASA